MNNTILFLLLLCIFLVVSLGINYSNIFSQTVTNMQTFNYTPTPITSSKYNSFESYELDSTAAQGVFSNTLQLNNHILEPMVSGKNMKTTPVGNSLSNKSIGSSYGLPDSGKGMSGISRTNMSAGRNNMSGIGRTNMSGIGRTNMSGISRTNMSGLGNASGRGMWSTNGYKPKDAYEGINSNVHTWRTNQLGSNDTANDNYEDSKTPLESENSIQNCATSPYGCCPDNVTPSNASGSICNPPIPPTVTGGCDGTQYGCCPDNITSKNVDGSNCEPAPTSCATSQYGCCPDGVTSKNSNGSSCSPYPPAPSPTPSCASSPYGCCLDGITAKNADGTNCSTMNSWTYNGSNVSGVVASGPTNSGYIIKGPNGNVYAGTTLNCKNTQFGCCPDNVTAKNVYGNNCPLPSTSPIVNVYGGSPNTGYPQNNVPTYVPTTNCSTSQYGCCPDNVTSKLADGSNCMPYGTPVGGCAGTQYGCCPDNVTAKLADGSNCMPYGTQIGGCAGTQYGCCPDNVTAKNSSGSNCSSYPPPNVTTNTVFIPPPRGGKVENSSYDTNSAPVDGTTYTCPQPPPCPPCGRCPEPSFDCKKVPNYSKADGTSSDSLPTPVLNDFSQFGM